MRNQLRTLTILLVLLSSSSCILLRIMPPVKATYVEGTVSQDTVWFLAESPFVLSGDVTVNPGVTLTIEPGVQVRFGGPCSLNIDGGIVADGTSEKKILFTTNDPTHGIVWQTIAINGTEPSSFVNCEIEYGTDGLTVNNGSVELRDSSTRFTSQNGLLVNDGSVLAADNHFQSNNSTGVHIVGGSQVTIANNTIESNQNGIVLGGQLFGAINITENSISNNTNSGITLEADVYGNTIITRNTVSANGKGFLVTNNTSPDLVHNYIFDNKIGIFYQDGSNHQAHFNDIYNNEVGMDISSDITVDATYNYWGDRTGPFHRSLNPQGKGNPVGGNGTELDFLFFLSMPSDHINQKPTANLWTDKTLVAPNQNIMFIGTDSQDEGRVDQYLLDFGDGINTGWITLSLFNHTYSSPGTYTAGLTVIDDFNTASENSAIASVTVQDLTPLRATLNPSSETTVYDGNVSLAVYASDNQGPVENADVTFFSLKGGTFSQILGQTNSTGYFETTFTAPNVTELANVGLIARVSKNGYADGSDLKYLKVLPPLDVHISPEPTIVNSEGNSTATVYVADTSGTPVSGADVSLFASNGTLSAGTGTTDVNGTATFVFTAPLTLEPINITLSATANKKDYASGTSKNIIEVQPKLLTLELTATPASVFSQESSTITIRVTHNFAQTPDAKVTMSSDVGGNLSAEEATTDSMGISQFIFTAPQTTLPEGIDATLTGKAVKTGYAANELSLIIHVKPKVLSTQIILPSNTTFSEAKINLTVSVKYGTTLVQNASINLTTQAGDFSTATGTTDSDGNLTLEFTAPQVSHSTNITITAVATKTGYAGNQYDKAIAVNPRTFSILIISPMINSGETADIRVQVTCPEDGSRVGDAHVVFSLNTGDVLSSTTDADGTCYFTLTSRQTSTRVLNMTANATKNGYSPGQETSSVIIIQSEGGLPILTIMMIIIPIVIVVVVAVLIKLKVIVVSAAEETSQ